MFYIVEIISNLWSLDFCKRYFFKEYCSFGVLIYFGFVMFIELYEFNKLVMHLNSCSMDFGREGKMLATSTLYLKRTSHN